MPSWYAVAHPGLEPVVAAELAEAGHPGRICPGGVRFDAPVGEGASLVRRLRTPDRLLLELVEGPTRSPDELVGLLRKVKWPTYLHPLAQLDIQVTSRASRMHFRGTVESKVGATIREAMKGPRVMDTLVRPRSAQRIQVRIDGDIATVSLDAGGDLLHRRGWRTDIGAAPLRENLAAALLHLADWDMQTPLVDPFCGSGTILIEAALMAARRSPFLGRGFAVDEWPVNTPRPGSRAAPRPREGHRPPNLPMPILVGGDIDARALVAASANAGRARVDIRWIRSDVRQLEAPAADGLIVTNPPWGRRLGGDEGRGPSAEAVYGSLGIAIQEHFPGWRAVFLAPTREMAWRVDRRARALCTFGAGGTRVTAYTTNDG